MSSLQNIDGHALIKDAIIKTLSMMLIKKRGPLLVSKICEDLEYVGPEGLMKIINQCPTQFEYVDDGQSLIRLSTKISICEVHCSKKNTCHGVTASCSDLHICKFYLLSGNCEFEERCMFGHDLTTEHNVEILKKNMLFNVSLEDVRHILHKSVAIPRICKYYNVGKKCRNLESGALCPNLHICRHYVLNNCKFDEKCKRIHDIMDPDVQQLLKKYGIHANNQPEKILADLRESINAGAVTTNPRDTYKANRVKQQQAATAKQSIADLQKRHSFDDLRIVIPSKTDEPRIVESAPAGISRIAFEQGYQKIEAETSSNPDNYIAEEHVPAIVTSRGDCAMPNIKVEQQSIACPTIRIDLKNDSVLFRYMCELRPKKKKQSDSDKQCLSEVWVSDYIGNAKIIAFCVDRNNKLHYYSLHGNNCVQGVYTNSCVIEQGKAIRLVDVSVIKPKMGAYMETQESVMEYLRQAGVSDVHASDKSKENDFIYLMFIVTFEDSHQTIRITSPPLYDNRRKSQRSKRHSEEVSLDKTCGKKRRRETENEAAVTATSTSSAPLTSEPEERGERAAFQDCYSKDKPKGTFIDTAGYKESALTWKAHGEALCSVCIICFPGGTGTGFRVGKAGAYIMTAAHVLEAIVSKGFYRNERSILQSDSVYAMFRYLKADETEMNHKFRFNGKIHFQCDKTDTAILEIDPDGEPIPPPFTLFGDHYMNNSFHFIGHSEGNPMEINTVDIILDMKSPVFLADVSNVKHISLKYANCDYESPPNHTLINENKVLFHCKFTEGASGSPGIVILSDGRKAVVTMLVGGYPVWYYEPSMKNFQKGWPKDEFCIEQGVNLNMVSTIMKREKVELWNEIFCVAN